MKRFDAGLEAARTSSTREMGELLALKAWYCDSTHRYTMTDAVQPLIVHERRRAPPAGNPKADRAATSCWRMAAISSTPRASWAARSTRSSARLPRKLRRLLLVRRRRLRQWRDRPSRPHGRGAHGLARGLPGLRRERQRHRQDLSTPGTTRSSEVEIFPESDATWRRPLGADGHFYRRQLEGFADTVLTARPMRGADVEDGVASVRAMVAIARSVRERQAGRASPMSTGPV